MPLDNPSIDFGASGISGIGPLSAEMEKQTTVSISGHGSPSDIQFKFA
jgi:hypothetical protein